MADWARAWPERTDSAAAARVWQEGALTTNETVVATGVVGEGTAVVPGLLPAERYFVQLVASNGEYASATETMAVTMPGASGLTSYGSSANGNVLTFTGTVDPVGAGTTTVWLVNKTTGQLAPTDPATVVCGTGKSSIKITLTVPYQAAYFYSFLVSNACTGASWTKTFTTGDCWIWPIDGRTYTWNGSEDDVWENAANWTASSAGGLGYPANSYSTARFASDAVVTNTYAAETPLSGFSVASGTRVTVRGGRLELYENAPFTIGLTNVVLTLDGTVYGARNTYSFGATATTSNQVLNLAGAKPRVSHITSFGTTAGNGSTVRFTLPAAGWSTAPIYRNGTLTIGAATKIEVDASGFARTRQKATIPLFYASSGITAAAVSTLGANAVFQPKDMYFVLSSDQKTLSVVVPKRRHGVALWLK